MHKQAIKVMLILVGLIMLIGCAAAPAASPSSNTSSRESGVAPAAAPAPAGATSDGTVASKPAQGQAGGGTGSAPLPQVAPDDRKIIRTGSLALVVKSPDISAADIQRIAESKQGFVQSSQVNESGEYRIGTVSIKVPSENYFAAMDEIKKLAVKIRSENSNAQDVTEEYNDIGTQLKTIRAQYDTYLELLKTARTTDDALKIRARIDELQTQINRLEGRRTFLDRNATLSTITITLTQVEAIPPIVGENGWDPSATVRLAVRALATFGRGIGDLLIYLTILVLWWLIPLIFLVRWLVTRNSKPRRSAYSQQTPPPAPPNTVS